MTHPKRLFRQLAALILTLMAVPALACSCPLNDRTFDQEVSARDDVFVGRVVTVEETPSAFRIRSMQAWDGLRRALGAEVEPRKVRKEFVATITVLERFKGAQGRTVEVHTMAANCRLWFEAGGTYLVFASRSGDKVITSTCSPTGLVDQRQDFLRHLRRASNNSSKPKPLRGSA